MNTQTHVMMAVAIAVPLAQSGRLPQAGQRTRLLVGAAILGGLIPDATVALMILTGLVQHVPRDVIFREWYFNDFWQGLGAMTNSIPLYIVLALSGWLIGRGGQIRHTGIIAGAQFLFVLAFGSLMHVLTDLPLHHDDGRPHFWPVTNWVYHSPVSYWNPAYHGRGWSVIETLLMAIFAIVIWRRYTGTLARILTVMVALSLLAVSGMWSLVLA